MTTNITTVAINLLIAGRLGFRETLADRIMVLLQQCEDNTFMEKELKNTFLMLMNKCVENPNCNSRDDFYQLAEFYNQKINGTSSGNIAA